MQQIRQIAQIFPGVPASDGAGVQLTRVIGSPYINQLDPFLLLDAFGSDKPQDYIAGFPPHPHRGFETVTYMLAGKMRHKDSVGNSGVIETGGVQWMTAGKGIIHSEMPEQEQGLLSGFQLWVNLPAAHKMTQPKYQEKAAQEIPVEQYDEKTRIKVIAGETQQGTQGVVENKFVDAIYFDVEQQKGGIFSQPLPMGHNAFIYLYEGEITVADSDTAIKTGQLAVLSDGDGVQLSATQNSKFLLIAGRPLNEPIARGGPFVMNTREEINQAFADYQAGNFAV